MKKAVKLLLVALLVVILALSVTALVGCDVPEQPNEPDNSDGNSSEQGNGVSDSKPTVTANANGGTFDEAFTVNDDGTINRPTTIPTKDGHIFVGWYKDVDCAEIWNIQTDKVTESIILYARWIKIDDETQGLAYELNGDGQSYAVKGRGTAKEADIVIPSSYEGMPVTRIDDQAFHYGGVKSIIIPDSVTSVGANAFNTCGGLASVVIGNSVKSIGKSAFNHCTSLTNVYYEGDIAGWCDIVFGNYEANPLYYAYNLFIDRELTTELIIPNTVKRINDYAFSHCESITSLNLSDSVLSIGKSAFHCCSNITSATIGDSVTTIGEFAFCNCSSLVSVTIGKSVTTIGSKAFLQCDNLEKVYWNATACTKLGVYNDYIFSGVNKISSVIIGDNVTTIGLYAFCGCDNLKSVYYEGDIAGWCNIDFRGSEANPSRYANDLYIDNKLVTGELIIPNTATKIGNSVFYGRTSITSVIISDTVTTIGNSAFWDCSNLASITIGNGITTIDNYAFSGDYNIKKIYYTGDIVGWCNIKFGDYGTGFWSYDLYIDKEPITELTIPDTVTEVEANAFCGCNSITSVTIGEGVTKILSHAFRWCRNVETVYWNATACTYAGRHTNGSQNATIFEYCDNLTKVIIGDNVTTIPSDAFYGCSKITSTTIGNGVKSISSDSFGQCSSLTNIIIGNSLTSIGNSAFRGCSGIKAVYYKGTADDWSNIDILGLNSELTNATRYYYSENEPELNDGGNYWHYVDGEVVVWKKES